MIDFVHVEYPRRAMAEIHRILKDDGIVIISSVMNFPIHAYPTTTGDLRRKIFAAYCLVLDSVLWAIAVSKRTLRFRL